VIAGKIATGAVTTETMTANAINGNVITFGTLNGDKITANTISGNTIIAGTIAGNTIIANSFLANTINGNAITVNSLNANSIVANSITTTEISSAYIYSGDIESFGATVGNVSSPGYWLAFASGDARFGGNVSIGANLNVAGLITTGNLDSNTVVTTTMQPSVVSNFQSSVGSAVYTVVTNPVSGDGYNTDQTITLTTTQTNQPVYLFSAIQSYWTNFTLAANSQVVLSVSIFRDATGITTDNYTYVSGPGGATLDTQEFTSFTGYTDAPATASSYTYKIVVGATAVAGSFSGGTIEVGWRNLTAQTLKR
jgi:hypothetical protein